MRKLIACLGYNYRVGSFDLINHGYAVIYLDVTSTRKDIWRYSPGYVS